MFSKLFKRVKSSKTVKKHSELMIGTLALSFASFLYQFAMGRLLGPADFAIFTALFSFVYVFNAFILSIQSGVAKVVGTIHAKGSSENGAVAYALRQVVLAGGILLVVGLFLGPHVSQILGVTEISFWILLFSLVAALIMPVFRGKLQGLQHFKRLSMNLGIEGFFKVVIGIVLVLVGFGVNGALFGILGSFLAAIIFAWNKGILHRFKPQKIRFFATTFPIFLNTLIVAAAYSLDVIIVKIRALDILAGHYAALSLFGKIIFFATVSVPQVVFAQAVDRKARKQETFSVLFKPLVTVAGLVLIGTIGYVIIGELLVTILLGQAYAGIGEYLAPLGFAMGALSLSSLICMYDLALSRWISTILLGIGVLVQVITFAVIDISLGNFVWSLVFIHGITLTLVLIASLILERRSAS